MVRPLHRSLMPLALPRAWCKRGRVSPLATLACRVSGAALGLAAALARYNSLLTSFHARELQLAVVVITSQPRHVRRATSRRSGRSMRGALPDPPHASCTCARRLARCAAARPPEGRGMGRFAASRAAQVPAGWRALASPVLLSIAPWSAHWGGRRRYGGPSHYFACRCAGRPARSRHSSTSRTG